MVLMLLFKILFMIYFQIESLISSYFFKSCKINFKLELISREYDKPFLSCLYSEKVLIVLQIINSSLLFKRNFKYFINTSILNVIYNFMFEMKFNFLNLKCDESIEFKI